MRIIDGKVIGAVRKSTRKQRVNDSGDVFALGETAGTAQAVQVIRSAPVGSVGDISALMAVQGVDVDERRSTAINHGFDTLDALDQLKIDVLEGRVSQQKLVHLANLVADQRAQLANPRLTNVLDHIELRARVELAKFERAKD